MAKHWKSFLPKDAKKKSPSSEEAAPLNLEAVAQSDERMRDLLKERKELESAMAGMSVGVDEQANSRYVSPRIPGKKENKAVFRQWSAQRDRSNKKELKKKKRRQACEEKREKKKERHPGFEKRKVVSGKRTHGFTTAYARKKKPETSEGGRFPKRIKNSPTPSEKRGKGISLNGRRKVKRKDSLMRMSLTGATKKANRFKKRSAELTKSMPFTQPFKSSLKLETLSANLVKHKKNAVGFVNQFEKRQTNTVSIDERIRKADQLMNIDADKSASSQSKSVATTVDNLKTTAGKLNRSDLLATVDSKYQSKNLDLVGDAWEKIRKKTQDVLSTKKRMDKKVDQILSSKVDVHRIYERKRHLLETQRAEEKKEHRKAERLAELLAEKRQEKKQEKKQEEKRFNR